MYRFVSTVTAVALASFLSTTGGWAFKAPEVTNDPQGFNSGDFSLPNEPLHLQKVRFRSTPALRRMHADDATRIAEYIFRNNPRQITAISNGFTLNGTAVVKKVLVDRHGKRHIRVTQTYRGIPVIGGEIVVHTDKKGHISFVNGAFLPDTDKIDTKPSIKASDALRTAKLLFGVTESKVRKQPELVIYNRRLAWHTVLEIDSAYRGVWHIYIDAHKGNVINGYNDIKYAAPDANKGSAYAVTGNRLDGEDGSVVTINGFKENATASNHYFLYSFQNKWGVFDTVVGDWEQNASSSWGTSDQAAVSCAANMETTQNYVSTQLKRDSFDDAGAFARSDIHVGNNLVNAYWDGNKFNFGDGDGSTANPLTVLDVVAHEYGHAITQHTSNLTYQNESGALNEAYSDILGTTVEFFAQPDGTSYYPDASPGKSDWLMGEDCWVSDTALRDMKDPQRYNQPSYYQGTNWYTGSADNGGVHTNSGVANFAFYLLAQGGSGTNDGHDYNITGLGVQKAAEIALNANYYYHTQSATYEDARKDWIQAASDLGYDTHTVDKVWRACGVGPIEVCSKDYSVSTSSFLFEDISTTGTPLNLGDDQAVEVTLPFAFPFYCGSFDTVYVNSNGMLSLKNSITEYTNIKFPYGNETIIAAFWDDLDPSNSGKIVWQVKGNAPNRRLIVQWDNVAHYSASDGTTFQIVLFENGRIEFRYADVTFNNTEYDNGASATVGLQYGTNKYLQYSYNQPVLHDNLRLVFNPGSNLVPIYYLLGF